MVGTTTTLLLVCWMRVGTAWAAVMVKWLSVPRVKVKRVMVGLLGDVITQPVGHPFAVDPLQGLHDVGVVADDQVDVG